MRIALVAVGKIRERHLRQAADEYEKRIARYARFEEIEVTDGARIARALPDRFLRVVLDAAGSEMSSAEFARFLADQQSRGTPGVAFVVGGAEGLPADVVAGAQKKLSLSRMTLPHRLARIVLAEQIYRAFTILRGEPYPR